MATFTAVSRVFDISELVEAILFQLPPRDILLAQRVCHTFKTAIDEFPRLQQALFFRNAPSKDASNWTVNPILRDIFLPWLLIGDGENKWSNGFMIQPLFDDEVRESFLNPDASWRRMLLVQPPPQSLTVAKYTPSILTPMRFILRKTTANVSFADQEPQGVTMAAVYDITLSFLLQLSESKFALSFHESSTSCPQITLHLIDDGGYDDRRMEKKWISKAKSVWRYSELSFQVADNAEPMTRSEVEAWTNDLTPERGGAREFEVKRWGNKRQGRNTQWYPESSYYDGPRPTRGF